MRIVRYRDADAEPRLGLVEPERPTQVLELAARDPLAALRGEREPTGRRIDAVDPETLELPPPFELLAPLVPPDGFTLQPDQRVEIHVPGIGTLVNPVGRAADLITEDVKR